jgi:hypothetical protein
VAAVAEDPQKQLDWEARQRPRAGIAAILSVLTLLGGFWGNLQIGNAAPSPSGLEALQRGVRPGPVNALPSLQIPRMQYIVDHEAAVLALGVVGLIAGITAGWSLGFLAVATRARRPELKRWVVYLPIVGGVLSGLYTMLLTVGQLLHNHAVLDGSRTVAEAAKGNGLLLFASALGFFALLASAGGYVLVSLNAMRAGLLTRLLGMIGIGTGVFFILPLPLGPLLQIMFQAALALLLFRAWMGGIPPAWDTGRAEPWPARQRATRRPAPAPASQPQAQPAGPAGPAVARRKRKKRH